jgi:hypothetical protein
VDNNDLSNEDGRSKDSGYEEANDVEMFGSCSTPGKVPLNTLNGERYCDQVWGYHGYEDLYCGLLDYGR